MQGFNGFPPGKAAQVRVPSLFFSELLPIIDHLAEMKVTLYCFWALQRQEGKYKYVRRAEMLDDTLFMGGFSPNTAEQLSQLDEGLERAVARGTLLHVTLRLQHQTDEVYFMNTASGRSAIDAIQKGNWIPGDEKRPIELIIERPNVFVVYEQNIGALTPHIADQLRHAEAEYPNEWIIEAIYLATERNIRKWNYINRILEIWHQEGKRPNGLTGQRNEQHDPAGEDFSDYIER